MRPLISTGDPKKSVDISRRAELYETSSGLVTITGGKLTTWRRMAKLAVDRIVEREDREAPCRTRRSPWASRSSPAACPWWRAWTTRAAPISPGATAPRSSCCAWPGRRVAGGADQPRPADIAAEAAYAAGHEQAGSVGDVLLRRTRLGLLDARRLTAPDDRPAGGRAAMATELGWDERRIEAGSTPGAGSRAEGLVPGQRSSVILRLRDRGSTWASRC